jgi:hypothetical protein
MCWHKTVEAGTIFYLLTSLVSVLGELNFRMDKIMSVMWIHKTTPTLLYTSFPLKCTGQKRAFNVENGLKI